MSDFLFIDYETLDVRPTAIVLSVGLLAANWDQADDIEYLKKEGTEFFFKIKEQHEKFGRTKSQGTIDWWKKQGADARRIFEAEDKISLGDYPKLFWDYTKEKGVDKNTEVLIRAPHFDFSITEDIFWCLEVPLPFSHWKVRDIRTYIDAWTGSSNGKIPGFDDAMYKEGLVKHNALHDCIIDCFMLQSAYLAYESGGDEDPF